MENISKTGIDRITVTLLFIFILFFLSAYSLADDEIVFENNQVFVSYSFEKPVINKTVINGLQYDRIYQQNLTSLEEYGKPVLPVRGAYILLPMGTEFSQIEVISGDKISLGKDFLVEPGGRPFPLSSTEIPEECIPSPNKDIYNSGSVFPSVQYEVVGQQTFRGYNILILRLYPIEYIPAAGELFYYKNFDITVDVTETDRTDQLYRGDKNDEQEVISKIDNPETIKTYFADFRSTTTSYDLLILTTATMANSFQPLKTYHDNNGILTEIRTIDDVGSNNPEDVRDYIRDTYINDGISYVLIGADDDDIPAADLYAYSWEGGLVTYDLPGDIYFGCLDGTYNYDMDSYYGEETDGENGGDIDLMAEVYVGRAPVDNVEEADRFVNKTLHYLNSQDPYLEKTLLVGQWIGLGGLGEYGGDSMDELVDASDTHGYSTYGIPQNIYQIDKLYDRDASWPSLEVVSRINDGRHIINHYGHSNTNWAMKLASSIMLDQFNNNDLFFIYSQGCLAGHFDGMDCWAEQATIKTDHGAFAAIMNVRQGFGSFNTTDGPSHRYNREFWDAIFNPDEGKPQLGRALQDCKEDNLYRINEGCMRWCYYEVTLFGDPTISLNRVRGITIDYPDLQPLIYTPNEEIEFRVEVKGVGNGIPVEGTGQLHLSIDNDPFQIIPMSELSPNEYSITLPVYPCGTRVEYYVSAEEQQMGRIDDFSPMTPKLLPIALGIDTAFTDDFETDKGWVFSGNDWARGVPSGMGGTSYSGPDPSGGHSSQNVLGYNLLGNYENNINQHHVISPAIDCSILSDVHLVFWRWLGVEVAPFDRAYIWASNNGIDWEIVWENESEIFDIGWNRKEIDISSVTDYQSTVYLRWTMGPTDAGLTYCGWNIDDVLVTGYRCTARPLTIVTESIPDWTADQPFEMKLISSGGVGVKTWSDKNGDLSSTGLTLSESGFLSGTYSTPGQIQFIASVSDELPDVAEKEYSFFINSPISIETEFLPPGTEEILYSFQLESSGGTGEKMWIDLNSGLSGSGLNLSSVGLVSGTVLNPITLNFIASVSDQTGSSDISSFSLEMTRLQICGDVNIDDFIDILDIVYLINYKYKDGPPPFPMDAADVNHDGSINILDIVYLINYKYKDGPKPICP